MAKFEFKTYDDKASQEIEASNYTFDVEKGELRFLDENNEIIAEYVTGAGAFIKRTRK